MKILESAEDYLETILVLGQSKSTVRSIDIVKKMNLSKPSVSRAIGVLKDGGFLTVDDNGAIHLTDSGLEVAKKIYERHRVLSQLLTRLGVDESIAAEDACRIEHVISDTSFQAVKAVLARMNENGDEG